MNKATPKRYVYELAKDKAEAEGLRDAGFGFETRKAAEKAHRTEAISRWRRNNMLKIFKLEAL